MATAAKDTGLLGAWLKDLFAGYTSAIIDVGKIPNLNTSTSSCNNLGYFKVPKLEFPNFNGDGVLSWFHKANRYFQFNRLDESQRFSLLLCIFRVRLPVGTRLVLRLLQQ